MDWEKRRCVGVFARAEYAARSRFVGGVGDPHRFLEVRLRDPADLEIAFFVASKSGSPFEQMFTGPSEEADAVGREAVAFVCDLIAERMVLALDPTPLRGGRRFLRIGDLTPSTLRQLAWIVSWRGARDWSAPDA
jgi:hypothetical protein